MHGGCKKGGVIREIYGRADAPSLIAFECGTVDEVREHEATFPPSKAGLLEWDILPLVAPATLCRPTH